MRITLRRRWLSRSSLDPLQAVRGLAIIWMGLGLFLVVLYGVGAMTDVIFPVRNPGSPPPEPVGRLMFLHPLATDGCYIALGLLIICLALVLLRLRRWAWRGLQVIAICLAALFATDAVADVCGLLRVWPAVSTETATAHTPSNVVLILGATVEAIWTGMFLLALFLLRLRAVREVFANVPE